MAALSASGAVVLSKAGLKEVPSSLAFALQAILILIISWGVSTSKGELQSIKEIPRHTWWFLAGAGILTTASSLLSFEALSRGEASQVNPLERLSLVFVLLLSAFFLKEKISVQAMVGAAAMMGGVLLIALSKK